MNKVDKEAFTKIPTFINTPLDILAINIFHSVAPVAVKIALSDGHFDKSEKEHLIYSLNSLWGFDKKFIEVELAKVIASSDEYSFLTLKDHIGEAFKKNKDIDTYSLRMELIKLAWEMVIADEQITNQETIEFDALKTALLGCD